MMTRKETTKFLSDLLITHRLSGMGKHWASEVTFDFGQGKGHQKRVDFVQFKPENQLCIAGLERGEFTCYEIKSCKEDFNSGNGLNFEGDKNYVVVTMKTYKNLLHNELQKLPYHVGIMVAMPYGTNKLDEFENPTEISSDTKCTLEIIKRSFKTYRERSTTEMLFCMVRSGK